MRGDLLLFASFVGLVLYFCLKRWGFTYTRKSSKGCSLPPGPRGLPIIGNLLQVPRKNPWFTYLEWGKEFDSDIISYNVLGTQYIVLNSVQRALDVLEKRSGTYSDRHYSTLLSELMGLDYWLSRRPYGDEWRDSRRLLQQYLRPADKLSHHERKLEYVRRGLLELYRNPEHFMEINRHMLGGLALSLAYGISAKPRNDPRIRFAEDCLRTACTVASPGYLLVDFFPLLKHLPALKGQSKTWRAASSELRDRPFADAEADAATFESGSFLSNALGNIDQNKDVKYQREVIKDTAAIIFAAGSDSTTAVINFGILAMLLHPEIQAKAQQELDRVLNGRLPDLEDESSLPYVTAILMEIIRWRSTAPLAVAHATTEDDIYDGFFIPKGSVVIPNAWAMLRDEVDYPHPTEFRPERFLTDDGQINPNVRNPSTIAFGFGRRVCAGAQFAQTTVWLVIASILTLFDISKPLDSSGNPIEPSGEVIPGLVVHSKPFKCVLKPRSAEAVSLLLSLE